MRGDAGATHRLDRQPIPSGICYRANGPPANQPVQPALAHELQYVLERFAREAGFGPRRPVSVVFRPGIFGHHKVGRAADIYGVGGTGLGRWKQQWDSAMSQCRSCRTSAERRATLNREQDRNLGWRLYKAIQRYGRWSHPLGYPIQLFGPWTRTEGPWKPISDRLLYAHRDHIHVSK